MAQPQPDWHCAQCGAVVPASPRGCDACRVTFRSAKTATLLSLAFPGAGLFYLGHPFLAAADLVGEVILYAVFLMLILEAEPGSVMPLIGVGAFFFLLTKLESVHLGRILASRCRIENVVRRSRFNRIGLVGGLASFILVGSALPLTGAARPVIDRDLEVSDDGGVWEGSRERAEWVAFGDDAAGRSQWTHPSGARLTIFAYPQRLLDSPGQFREEARRGFIQQGSRIVKDDTELPVGFSGFRFVVVTTTPDGDPLSMVHAFVIDRENHDIHHVLAALITPDTDAAEELVDDLLRHARWIPAATSPVRAGS